MDDGLQGVMQERMNKMRAQAHRGRMGGLGSAMVNVNDDKPKQPAYLPSSNFFANRERESGSGTASLHQTTSSATSTASSSLRPGETQPAERVQQTRSDNGPHGGVAREDEGAERLRQKLQDMGISDTVAPLQSAGAIGGMKRVQAAAATFFFLSHFFLLHIGNSSINTAPTSEQPLAQASRQQPKLDITDKRGFLGRAPPKYVFASKLSPPPLIPLNFLPPPSPSLHKLLTPLHHRVGMVCCHIVRDRSGMKKLHPEYSLYLESGGDSKFLLAARKRKKNKTSNYLISMDVEDLHRSSGNFYGKVRSNFLGTEFMVYDRGEKSSKDSGLAVRQELAAVLYETNIMGSKVPRRMIAVVPSVDASGKRAQWKPEGDDSENLINAYKANERKEDMMILENKKPSWDESLRAYVLNFKGRVTVASVKNFQLVEQGTEKVCARECFLCLCGTKKKTYHENVKRTLNSRDRFFCSSGRHHLTSLPLTSNTPSTASKPLRLPSLRLTISWLASSCDTLIQVLTLTLILIPPPPGPPIPSRDCQKTLVVSTGP